jgi:uncharacterized protein YidB (DUF937 family)
MLALLGLLAVAGYQNRDRIREVLGNIGGGRSPGSMPGLNPSPGSEAPGSGGGLGGLLGGLLGGSGIGDTVHGGLSDLLNHFTGNGQGQAASSWVQTGPNRELNINELEGALGEDTIAELTNRTGLSRTDLLTRLQGVLPSAVDQMTPDGRLPNQTETADWLNRGARAS